MRLRLTYEMLPAGCVNVRAMALYLLRVTFGVRNNTDVQHYITGISLDEMIARLARQLLDDGLIAVLSRDEVKAVIAANTGTVPSDAALDLFIDEHFRNDFDPAKAALREAVLDILTVDGFEDPAAESTAEAEDE
jgi:hypothetical protein